MNQADINALRMQAERALGGGDFAHATDAYLLLLAAEPSSPDDWYNLGYTLRCRRDYTAALDAYAQALERGVRDPEAVHLNRAAILAEHLDRNDEAAAELRAAVAVNPRFTLAWLNLGNLAEDTGDAEAARGAYRSALEIEPNNGRAIARLAMIDIAQGAGDNVPARLRTALASHRATPDDKAEIGFALGHALDAAGLYADAFAAFGQANAIRSAQIPATHRYDRAGRERLVDALIQAFPLAGPPRPTPTGTPPIFILGMFRSGSTLAEQILARHSRVTAGGEFDFLPGLVLDRLQPYPASLATVAPDTLEGLRADYLASMTGVHPDADVLTDKRCDNFLHVGLIMTLFPGARIVHTVRDPLDTILSNWFLDFDLGVPYGCDLGDAAHWYRQYRRLMAHWTSLYPHAIHDHDYDAAVGDPEPAVRSLAAFCGLDWEDAMLQSAATSAPVRTASAWQVRQPIHARSSGRWRNYEPFLGPVIEELAKV